MLEEQAGGEGTNGGLVWAVVRGWSRSTVYRAFPDKGRVDKSGGIST